MEFVIDRVDRVENIVGKGENAGDQHVIFFSQCFQKAFHQGRQKSSLPGYVFSIRFVKSSQFDMAIKKKKFNTSKDIFFHDQ